MTTTPAITLSLSGAERQVFGQLYALADPGQSGVITGDAAVKFFEGFKLPTLTLGQIWSIADSGNNGFLTPNAFAVALRLIARAQRGESFGEAETQIQGAPPTYEGLSTPSASEARITPEDKARFTRIFTSVGPSNGLLSGDQAKEVFMKSKLPFSKLGAIWNLADTKARGMLDQTDFVIGMYYIQGTMNGTIPSIPSTLPAGLYEQASNTPTAALQPQRTGTDPVAAAFGSSTPSASAVPAMPPRNVPSSRSSSLVAPPMATPGASSEWAISAQEKAKFDTFFDSLDTGKTGMIEGAMVVPFFMQSGLDEPTLAHVWDLSDLTQDGQLSRDEFAVAMRLINDKIEGKPLPEQLPSALLPPSMRTRDLPEAVDVKQSETQKELFSLLDTDVPTMSPSVAATAFGERAPGVGASLSARAQPPSQPPSQLPSQPPSQPPSQLPSQPPAQPSSQPPSQPPSMRGTPAASTFNAFDDDFGAPAPVSGGAEVGNTQNALNSTTKSLDELKERRATAESASARNATSLAELEAQLQRARTEHESESAAVRELETRVQSQSSELDALRQEVIRAESELSAARTQKDELEQKLLQDREALRETKQQLAELQTSTAQLREEKERIAKDARQHAGLSAIATKQLATAQAEHEQVRAMPTEPVEVPPPRAASVTPRTATPSGTRRNPFEMFASEPMPEPLSGSSNTFESQYGAYGTPEAPSAPAPAPEAARYAASLDHSSDEVEPPEEVERNAQDTPADADVYSGIDNASGRAAAPMEPAVPAGPLPSHEPISVPGGFPGESDESRAEISGSSLAHPSAPPPPPPHAAVPVPAIHPVERAPTDWSIAATTSSTPAATPGANKTSSAKTPSGLDDFDSAFANLGLAHVVHGTPSAGAAPSSFDAFDENFGSSFAPPPATAPATSRTSAGGPDLAMPSGSRTPGGSAAAPVPAPATTYASPLSYLASTQIAPRADGGSGSDAVSGARGATSGRPAMVVGKGIPNAGGVTMSPVASTGAPSAAPAAGTPPPTASASGGPTAAPVPTTPAAGAAPSGDSGAAAPEPAPSPSLPDDAGPVRQLCQMGFSRSQVIRALERCGYRTERALEHLLSNSGRA